MKKTQIFITCLFICTGLTCVKADTILGLYAGAQYWQHDLADDLGLSLSDRNIHRSENGNVFYMAIEHPIPFLPNAKLQQNNIKAKGSGHYQLIGIFGVENYYVLNKSDLSHTDFTFYYEVLDNWLNIDVGLSVKYFDGYTNDFSIATAEAGTYHSVRNDLDEWIPLIYAKGQVDLPFTGFTAYGSIQTLSLNSTDVTDAEIGVNYESSSGLGAALGYRTLDVDFVNDENLTAKAKTDGFFVGVNFHF